MDSIGVTDIFLKGDFIDIEIKPSSCKIFEIFCIECAIGYIDDFSFGTHDFCVVKVDLLDDPFYSFNFYSITDFEGFTEYDRKASEKVSNDIFTGKGKYSSSDSCSSEELACIYLEIF